MLYIVHIKDKHERIQFAAHIKKLLRTANIEAKDYIPGKNNQIIRSDIGIKADGLDKKTLAQVLSQIERRGYTILNAKGSETSSLIRSAASSQQKTTGEITNGNTT